MKAFSIVFGGAFLSVVLSVYQLRSEEMQPSIVMRDITVAERDFTLPQLEKVFRGLLHEGDTVPRVLKVEAYTDQNAFSGTFKYTTDVSYDTWSAWYLDYAKAVRSSAELLSVPRAKQSPTKTGLHSCVIDEGRPFGATLQEEASNYPPLLLPKGGGSERRGKRPGSEIRVK